MKKHSIKERDILYDCWGYDQTNVDFYQVVKTSDKSVWFRKISDDVKQDSFMSGHVTAVKDYFIESKINRRPVKSYKQGDKTIIFVPYDDHELSLWDGKPLYCSWYA